MPRGNRGRFGAEVATVGIRQFARQTGSTRVSVRSSRAIAQFRHEAPGVRRSNRRTAAESIDEDEFAQLTPEVADNSPPTNTNSITDPSMHPQFKGKNVCTLRCRSCYQDVCTRAMKAILLADTRVELYSTDRKPPAVDLINEDYVTSNCQCRIRDIACLGCGSPLGYHVVKPCQPCINSCNNGMVYIIVQSCVTASERIGEDGKVLRWERLPPVESDVALAR